MDRSLFQKFNITLNALLKAISYYPPESTQLLGSKKDKYGEDVSKLESVVVVLVHCNLPITIFNKHLKFYPSLY